MSEFSIDYYLTENYIMSGGKLDGYRDSRTRLKWLPEWPSRTQCRRGRWYLTNQRYQQSIEYVRFFYRVVFNDSDKRSYKVPTGGPIRHQVTNQRYQSSTIYYEVCYQVVWSITECSIRSYLTENDIVSGEKLHGYRDNQFILRLGLGFQVKCEPKPKPKRK